VYPLYFSKQKTVVFTHILPDKKCAATATKDWRHVLPLWPRASGQPRHCASLLELCVMASDVSRHWCGAGGGGHFSDALFPPSFLAAINCTKRDELDV